MVGFQQFTEFNDRHRYSTVKLHGLAWLLCLDYSNYLEYREALYPHVTLPLGR